MSTTYTYSQVRKPEHSTLGDALTRFARDADAFTAGAQYALDHLMSRLERAMPQHIVFLEDVAADILSNTQRGEL